MRVGRKTSLITVPHTPVTIMNIDQCDYISLTDMAKARTDATRAADVIKNWLRSRTTLNSLVLGRFCIIRISKWSNSTTLERKLVYIHLH